MFGNPERLNQLTSIVWPATRESIRRNVAELRASGAKLPIVVEAAILIEANWQPLFDEIWLVRALARTSRRPNRAPARTETGRDRGAHPRTAVRRGTRKARDTVIENNGSLEELRDLLKKSGPKP